MHDCAFIVVHFAWFVKHYQLKNTKYMQQQLTCLTVTLLRAYNCVDTSTQEKYHEQHGKNTKSGSIDFRIAPTSIQLVREMNYHAEIEKRDEARRKDDLKARREDKFRDRCWEVIIIIFTAVVAYYVGVNRPH